MTLQEMVAYSVIAVGELQHLGTTRLSHVVILSSSPFHNQLKHNGSLMPSSPYLAYQMTRKFGLAMIQPSLVMSCLTELLGVWTAFILQSDPCQIVEHPWGR